MKKRNLITFFILIAFFGCNTKEGITNTDSAATYTNPILSGFYPDPSICKVGDDYYLTTSSFAYFPGLPLFHSKDLVNWNQIGHILDRNEQLNLEGQSASRGLFAPAIAHDGNRFYAICTNIDFKGNFVVTATDPAGPWSNPVWLPEIKGIDPSIYFDESGKSFIIYNSDPPNGVSLYSGHRTIKMVEFDKENLEVISEPEIIVNGGADLTKEPVWIEAPHIYKRNDWYYLMCAEGGTSWNHSEVIFRTKSLDEPFVPWENNPILTQRHLDPDRENPVGCAGHADMVIGPDGNWWTIFLGTRPYEGNYYNIGRETFLLPVTWENDWPTILADSLTVPYELAAPKTTSHTVSTLPLNGNYTLVDEFDELHMSWTFLRNPETEWHRLANGALEIDLKPETMEEHSNPAFVAKRLTSHYGSLSTKMDFAPQAENEQAGLLLFQNESRYYFLSKEQQDDKTRIVLHKVSGDDKSIVATQNLENEEDPVFLKIDFKGKFIDFSIGTDEANYSSLAQNLDATILSTETGGGFVGTMVALYGSSKGKESSNSVNYDWFKMTVDEDIYK